MLVEHLSQACELLGKEQDMTDDTLFHGLCNSTNSVTKLVEHMRIDNVDVLSNSQTYNL